MDSPVEIGLLLYPGVQMASVLGMTDFLLYADQAARGKRAGSEGAVLRITHWTLEAGPVPERVFDSSPTSSSEPAIVVIPPAMAPLGEDAAMDYAQWLQGLHAKGAKVASVCAGTFVLAATGLLSGRTVTTHWFFKDALQARLPDAFVDTDRLIIDDGEILTAGGIMAWTDLTLKLIGRLLGGPIMIQTARAFVVDPPGREQAYYSAFAPKLDHGDAAILKVQHWLQTTDTRETDLETMAAHAGLEKRTFLRRFQKATGLTSTDYVQRLRVGRAQELLQFTAQSLEQIAWKVGYADVGAFRKVFTRVVELSPSDYRKRFRAMS
ncbi:GlxA family transcriptional regulator [Luteimonas marina]|nr:helix-turn-helix domain-containing protein [Luteimonas marina]